MNKKGLSDVITTVLIIVLALAAVAIIGAVVMNNVRKAGGTADALSICQSIDMAYSSCVIGTGATGVLPNTLIVNMTQNSEVKPNKIYAIWYGSDGAALGSSDASKVSVPATVTRYVTSSPVSIATTANPVATTAKFVHVVTVDGKDYDCPVPTLAVTCS